MKFFSILQTILDNEFLSDGFRQSMQKAGQSGHAHPGSCEKFVCSKQVLPTKEQDRWARKISSHLRRPFLRFKNIYRGDLSF
jgi:hypothetical protein